MRDYTDQNVVIDELCPFTKITDKNGKSKVVRKSSVVSRFKVKRLKWRMNALYLEFNVQPKEHYALIRQMPENSVVWRNDNLYIGDWCFFVKETNSTPIENVYVGQVVAFKYIVGRTAQQKQYSWNNAPVDTKIRLSLQRGINVLATWYQYHGNGDVIPIQSNVKHFFAHIKNYVGTTNAIE